MAVLERFGQCVRKISPGDEVWNLRGPMEMPDHAWHALAVCPCEHMYASVVIDGEIEQRTVDGVELKEGETILFVKPVWVGRVKRVLYFSADCPGDELQLIQ